MVLVDINRGLQLHITNTLVILLLKNHLKLNAINSSF